MQLVEVLELRQRLQQVLLRVLMMLMRMRKLQVMRLARQQVALVVRPRFFYT